MLNKKNIKSKRDKPTPPLSAITSSYINISQSSQSKTINHSNIENISSPFQKSKENIGAYVPILNVSDNLCENIQPTKTCTPVYIRATKRNVEHVQTANDGSTKRKMDKTLDV